MLNISVHIKFNIGDMYNLCVGVQPGGGYFRLRVHCILPSYSRCVVFVVDKTLSVSSIPTDSITSVFVTSVLSEHASHSLFFSFFFLHYL